MVLRASVDVTDARQAACPPRREKPTSFPLGGRGKGGALRRTILSGKTIDKDPIPGQLSQIKPGRTIGVTKILDAIAGTNLTLDGNRRKVVVDGDCRNVDNA